MKIITVGNLEANDVSKEPLFVGGKVTLQNILEEPYSAKKIQVAMVNFAAGARNKLHSHATEQILIVTEGKGLVATRDEEHIVTSGMVIFVPAGEAHWHGATKDSTFSHLSIIGTPHETKISEK